MKEKIDIEEASLEYETIEREAFSHFVLFATIDIDTEIWDEEERKDGIRLYNAGDIFFATQIEHLNDKYAVQIVNKLLKNWPFNYGEKYIDREKELTIDTTGRPIIY